MNLLKTMIKLNSQEESKKSYVFYIGFFLLFLITRHKNNFKGCKESIASLTPVKPSVCSPYTLKRLKMRYREPESLWRGS